MKANELRIVEYYGYDVREDGVIFSKRGNDTKMKFRNNDKGYPCVGLVINKKPTYKSVHRIMAECFIPNPDNKPCVNHIDRNRENFDLDNLEWVTHSENVRHSVANGGRKDWTRDNNGINNPNAKLNEHQIQAIRDLWKIGYSQPKIGKVFGLNQSRISKIVNNIQWKAYKLTN